MGAKQFKTFETVLRIDNLRNSLIPEMFVCGRLTLLEVHQQHHGPLISISI